MSQPRTVLGTITRYLWNTFVVLVVSAAVLLSVARLLLPEAGSYRETVEHWASAYLGQPVHITSMDASLEGLTPTVTFKGVRLMDAADKHVIIRSRELRIGLRPLASLREGRLVPAELTVVGAELAVTRSKSGQISIRGIQGVDLGQDQGTAPVAATGAANKAAEQGPSSQLTQWLFQRDVLALRDCRIQWHDLRRGEKPVVFSDVNLWLRNLEDQHRLTGYVQLPPALGKRLELAIDMRGDVLKPATLNGRFYLLGEGLHPQRIGLPVHLRDMTLQARTLDMQLWGRWSARHLTGLSGSVYARQLRLSATKTQAAGPVTLARAGARVRWLRTTTGWELDMDRVQIGFADHAWPESQLRVVHTAAGAGRDAGFIVDTSYLRLDDLATVLGQTGVLDKARRAELAALKPRGEVHAARVQWQAPVGSAPAQFKVQTRFSDLSLKAYRHFPGVERIAGSLWLDNTRGELRLASTDSTLDLPRLFRQPLPMDRLSAVLDWEQRGGIWYLRSHSFDLTSLGMQASGDLLLEAKADSSPYMQLFVHFSHGDAAQVPRYLPAHIMEADTVKWLDQAFVSGTVNEGGLVFNGRLADFPFSGGRGQFQVQFRASDLSLSYQKGWPDLRDLDADAHFTGHGVTIRLSDGRLYNSQLSAARVAIAQFTRPLLTVQGQVSGPTADAVRFLAESPIAASARSTLKAMTVTGKSVTDIRLHIPLSSRVAKARPLNVTGKVRLMDSRLRMFKHKLDVAHINGVVHFTQDSQEAKDVQAVMFGEHTRINVYSAGEQAGRQTVITARGRFATAKAHKLAVFSRSRLGPWLAFLHGTVPWQAALTLDPGKTAIPVRLRVTSELAGMAIDLPAPLGKTAADARTLAVDVAFVPKRPQLNVSLSGVGGLALGFRHTRDHVRLVRAALDFSASQAVLPASPVFMVKGDLQGVSPAAWARVMDTLHAAKTPGQKNATAASTALEPLPVELDMGRLYLVKDEPFASARTSDTTTTSAPGSGRRLEPGQLPLINGTIRDLRYDDMALGQLQLRTRRAHRALVFSQVAVRGAHGVLQGQGRWTTRGRVQESVFKAEVNSSDFGAYLQDLGFASVMNGGKGKIDLDVSWPASPFDFSFAHLDGNVTLHVGDGSITELNPGAGRLFGLLSLNALPRRLMLDFGDVFKKGLSFDSISGNFAIVQGNATTHNLELKSPSANIHVQGRTGLAARDYDQLVTVVPQVGSTLPLAGGLAWGAQAGVVILLFQKLFKSDIDKVTQYQYRITGSWAHPRITRLSASASGTPTPGKAPAKASPATPPTGSRPH